MKTFGIALAIFTLPFFASAQGKLKSMDDGVTFGTQTTDGGSGSSTVYKSRSMPVVQNTGKVYNEEDLLRMPRREVNALASTIAGVDSRPGTNETPNIRGAGASGTAYYVDGVRIYGAMPIMTK